MNDLTRFNKLTSPENREEYRIESLKKTEDEILFLCAYQLKVTAAVAYFVGQRLIAVRKELGYGKFSEWLGKKFHFAKRTAYNYITFYEILSCANFAQLDDTATENPELLEIKKIVDSEEKPDCEKLAQLAGLTMKEALTLAGTGVIQLKKPKKESCVKGYNRIDLYGNKYETKSAEETGYDVLFNFPSTIKDLPLKNHRTLIDQFGSINMIRRLFDERFVNTYITHMHEQVPDDPSLRLAFKDMTYEIQTAVEKYLWAVEQYDNRQDVKQLYDARTSRSNWTKQKKQEEKEKRKQGKRRKTKY